MASPRTNEEKVSGTRDSLLPTQVLLTQEYLVRLRFLTYSRFFGRAAFIVIIGTILIAAPPGLIFQILVVTVSILLSASWSAENATQRRTLIRLSHMIARSEEREASVSWEDNYIRFDYYRFGAIGHFIVSIYGAEPIYWLLTVLLVFFLKFASRYYPVLGM
jgi:hypothetical protein